MSVRVVGYVDEALMARLVERATVEGRTLSNMIERLLSLGLGTVVTERVGESARQSGSFGTSGLLSGGDSPGDLGRVSQSTRSVTPETCPKRHNHKLFSCDCGWLPPRDRGA